MPQGHDARRMARRVAGGEIGGKNPPDEDCLGVASVGTHHGRVGDSDLRGGDGEREGTERMSCAREANGMTGHLQDGARDLCCCDVRLRGG